MILNDMYSNCYDMTSNIIYGMETIHHIITVVVDTDNIKKVEHIPRFDYSHDDPECNLPIRNIALPHETLVIKIFKNERFKVYCPHCEKYFWTTIKKHLDEGYGCSTCPSKYQDGKYGSKYRASMTRVFRTKAMKLNKSRGIYDRCYYISNDVKMWICCRKHGYFYQSSVKHLIRKCWCPKCNRGALRSWYDVLADFNKRHDSFYIYDKFKYVNTKTSGCIICPIHGEFWQRPENHLLGARCPKCNGRLVANTEEFILESILRKGEIYNYSKVDYIKSTIDVCIICPIHGEFWQTPHKHLLGRGCPSCTNIGYNRMKSGTFYYVRINTDNGPLFKVGITNTTIDKRFKREHCDYTILFEWSHDDGRCAFDIETRVKRLCKMYQYQGIDILPKTGSSEIYSKNITEYIEFNNIISDVLILLDYKGLKTIIAGSRNIYNYTLIEKAVRDIPWCISEVVSGKARGVDLLGEQYANENNIPIKPFPANWNKYKKAAGHIRNAEMANYADAAIVIWDGRSKGSAGMLNLAKKKNLKLHEVITDG